MSRFAYVVGATYGYIPELTALLNSLDYVGNTFDVIVIGIELTEELLSQFSKLSYKVIHRYVTEAEWQADRGRSETVCRKRYWYAAEYGKDYEAVCVLDADMVFTRNPYQYFEIAAKTGFIVGVCKEQNKVYDDPHHYVDGQWVWGIPVGYYNDKDLCNSPLFLDARLWGEALKYSWDIFINRGFKAPDMDAMNLSFLHYGGHDKIIKLPGNAWLGTNEQHLKPYIRAVTIRGQIQTESGIEIYSYHGHYYHEKWRLQQLENRHNCAAGYLKATECCDSFAQGSLNMLYENFLRMLDYKIQIEKKNYRV